MSKLLLRFDDITPGMSWSKFLPLKSQIEDLGIKSILGVVPECKDTNLLVEDNRSDFFELIRAYKNYGDSIFQHGTYHIYKNNNAGILGINSKSEFSGLSLDDQTHLIKYGKDILLEQNLWEPNFMAPAHSFDINTLIALKRLGFNKITDGYGFFPYGLEEIILIPQLVSRILPLPFGIQTICVHINTMEDIAIKKLIESIKKNKDRFININKAIEIKPKFKFFDNSTRKLSEGLLKYLRKND